MRGNLAQGFVSYLDRRSLPCQAAEVRRIGDPRIVVALIDHAPAPGNEYAPVDDLILSVVVRSNHGIVERGVGGARQTFREAPSTVIVTPPRTPSYWAFCGTPQVVHIAISASWIDEFASTHRIDVAPLLEQLAPHPLADPFIAMLAERLWLASGDDSLLGRAVTDQVASLILPALLNRDVHGSRHAQKIGLAPWRYRRATELLSRLDVRVSIREIAEELGLSPSHFVRAFKTTAGKSPHQWLSAKRIDQAKALLCKSGLSLTDIANALGFSSSSHFSTAFRAATGVSPSHWRSAFQSTAQLDKP